MNNFKKVAVLLATYNGGNYLREQLDSVLSQEKVQLDIFLRDDQSIDETNSILEEYTNKYSNFRLLKTSDKKLGPGRNFFSILIEIDVEKYDFISYCDQDDKWLLNKLNEAINKIETNNANCYGSNLFIWDGQNVTGILDKATPQTEYDFLFESGSAGCTLVIDKKSTIFLKQQVLKHFDKFSFQISHDWYTYAITRIGGFKWFLDDRAFIYYRQHLSNQYGANGGVKGIKKLLKLFGSGWYLSNINTIINLFCIIKPSFHFLLINYNQLGFIQRVKLAYVVSKYRRKFLDKFYLFFLIIFKIIK